MSILFVALALLAPTLPAPSPTPVVFQATNPEAASAYGTMAECELALGPPADGTSEAGVDQGERRGSRFNRSAGNISRCEMVDGEPMITVYPTGQKGRSGQ